MVALTSFCLWVQTFRLAVPCRHSTGWTGGPQRAAILGAAGSRTPIQRFRRQHLPLCYSPQGGRRSFPAVANHVLVHRRFNVSRILSVPKHTCPKENLNDLAFGHVSVCPQLQHRGLRGLLQDLASPKRLPAKTLFTRGVHVELVVSAGIEPAAAIGGGFRRALCQLSYDTVWGRAGCRGRQPLRPLRHLR